ncbi:pantoate--beta-alanine ligase [Subtercola boreus]|uniref:Pantothenate synthetase n=1 Tax=Subtercola boreus TaxID=120213 RepID=A0A3E0W751_9MICO|nr:pantoate--beta-alanine ligase [Subtercola boreus]RFA18684.1 pantoate--beta-alanine ligase [Subtercola boreus]RFA25287.1 pantoate--beta-alanine ligase [Subtercola boreus]
MVEVRAAVAAAVQDARGRGVAEPRVALVPTMGALHDGHLALVARAQDVADVVVVSVFVNPLQFSETEDLDRYPRDLDADLDTLAGVDREGRASIVFAPTASEMYPDGKTQTKISAGDVGNRFEGRSRAGHFDGVLVVVDKLLNIVQPHAVLFGQKDAQQVFVVSRMVRDLNIPVTVEVVETVREDDGLALSSRNRFLDERERLAARVLSRTLEAAESAAVSGIDAVIAAAQSAGMGEPLVQLEYFSVVNPATFRPVDDNYRGRAIVLVAARVGATRLIDNESIYLG